MKKEAEYEAEKQRFILQMERDFAENSDEIDWNVSQTKYSILYNHNLSLIDYVTSFVWQRVVTYYTTNKEWLEQYIKDNEADIKKYIFGIKEKNK